MSRFFMVHCVHATTTSWHPTNLQLETETHMTSV